MVLQEGQARSKNISKKQKQTIWGKDGTSECVEKAAREINKT